MNKTEHLAKTGTTFEFRTYLIALQNSAEKSSYDTTVSVIISLPHRFVTFFASYRSKSTVLLMADEILSVHCDFASVMRALNRSETTFLKMRGQSCPSYSSRTSTIGVRASASRQWLKLLLHIRHKRLLAIATQQHARTRNPVWLK